MKKLIFKYGFELEVKIPGYNEGLFSSLIGSYASLAHDGSIRATDNQFPVEVRSYVGSRKFIEQNSLAICNVLKQVSASVNQSCGYHLHVSNKNFFVKRNLNRIVFFWCAIEDVLISTQPRSRYGNEYCRRKLGDLMYHDPFDLPVGKERLISSMSGTNRYFALNLQALQKHGTIEIRLHAGTINNEKIINWIDLITDFFTYALKRYNHIEVLELFNTKISDEKIERVFELLKLQPKIKQHFLERIERFSFDKLAQEQGIASEFMKILPSYRKKRRAISKMEKDLRIEIQKLEDIRNHFNNNIHSQNRTSTCDIPGCPIHNLPLAGFTEPDRTTVETLGYIQVQPNDILI